MMSRGQATGSEIVCIRFPQLFSSNPFPNASSQGQGTRALTGKGGRRQPHPRHLAVASQPSLGFRDAPLILWDPTSGWTPWSQCRAASRACGPHPRPRASGHHRCCGWVWGGGVARRVQPEVLLGRAVGGSATGVGGAGGTRVNVRPARASVTQFHQKLEGEEAADLPRTLSRTEAGRDLRRPHPVHLRR